MWLIFLILFCSIKTNKEVEAEVRVFQAIKVEAEAEVDQDKNDSRYKSN